MESQVPTLLQVYPAFVNESLLPRLCEYTMWLAAGSSLVSEFDAVCPEFPADNIYRPAYSLHFFRRAVKKRKLAAGMIRQRIYAKPNKPYRFDKLLLFEQLTCRRQQAEIIHNRTLQFLLTCYCL